MTPDSGESGGTSPVTIAVGLDYETDQPWVWTGARVVDDAEDATGWFVVEVPAAMAERFEAAKEELDAAVEAIHGHVGYVGDRLREPCREYVGRSVTIGSKTFDDPCDGCGWKPTEHRVRVVDTSAEGRVTDLMAALEKSVADARAAREARRGPA